MELWDYYTPEELKKLFKEKPLTADCVNYILSKKIKKIEFSEHFTVSSTMHCNEKYIVYVSLIEECPQVGLIHELIHIYYNVGL
ncbi:hypothetical protein KY308_03670, partial [Candidatus Woesearchaeota archaeon]|nr:hypothetical protein [Candidatus Woesearchaeota archaeon]